MEKHFLFLFIVVVVFSGCNKNDNPNIPEYNSLKEEINYLADKYVKIGAAVGVIDMNQEKNTWFYGTKSVETSELPDANTVFDIGSITKTFTAVLAAEMLGEQEITDGIVQHYLPSDKVKMPTAKGVEITFENLLTHMSGLPRTPHINGSNFPRPQGFVSSNPYTAYTTEDVYNYLTNYCTLEFTPGTYWGYSNTGYGLLGHTLGLIEGTSYESILTSNIFDVLKMNNSSLFLTDQQLSNIALGHDSGKNIVSFYTANDIFQGAGMIKSTLNDMFKYLEANMGLKETPLKNAMERTHRRTPDIYTGSMGYIGLAWYIIELNDGQEIIYTGGNTNGHAAYLAFNPSTLTGAIVLFNSSQKGGTNLEFGHELMMAINNY